MVASAGIVELEGMGRDTVDERRIPGGSATAGPPDQRAARRAGRAAGDGGFRGTCAGQCRADRIRNVYFRLLHDIVGKCLEADLRDEVGQPVDRRVGLNAGHGTAHFLVTEG